MYWELVPYYCCSVLRISPALLVMITGYVVWSLGSLFALMHCGEGITYFLAPFMFQSLYADSIDYFTGFVFVLSVILLIIPVGLMMWVHIKNNLILMYIIVFLWVIMIMYISVHKEQILLTSFGNDVCESFGSQHSSSILIFKVHRQKDRIPFL